MYIIYNLNFVAPGNMSGKIIRRTDYGSESEMAVSTLEMVKKQIPSSRTCRKSLQSII